MAHVLITIFYNTMTVPVFCLGVCAVFQVCLEIT